MKLHIHLTFLFLPILLLSLILTACNTKFSSENSFSDLPKTNSKKYIIQTPLYQVYEKDLQKYSYKIGIGTKVFAEGIKNGTEPQIEEIDNGIIRLFMGFGTNAFSVQYFDIWGDRTSKVFSPYSIYADYTDSKGCLIAYFPAPDTSSKNALLIKEIFNDDGFSTEIDRDFISNTCNELKFLNENEIYLDYDILADGYSKDDLISGRHVEFKNIREVIKFR